MPVDRPLHRDTLIRRIGIVRHGLAHLLDGKPLAAAATGKPPPWPRSLLCRRPGSAILVGRSPRLASRSCHPSWTPDIIAGLRRLGLARWSHGSLPGAIYDEMLSAYDQIRSQQPEMTAQHIDHFLSLVAFMEGRSFDRAANAAPVDPVAQAVSHLRQREGLRERLKQRGQQLAQGQELLPQGLARCDGKKIGDTLAAADPFGAARSPLDWGEQAEMLTLWVGRLWEADDPTLFLKAMWEGDSLPGAGLWLPAAVLYYADPQRFTLWNETLAAAWPCWTTVPTNFRTVRSAAIGCERGRGLAAAAPPWAPSPEAPLCSLSWPTTYSPAAIRGRGRPASVQHASFGGFCRDT